MAEGKISLDLQYKLRERRLQGENQIVIDRLTLGERVDSPGCAKLPLQLAIAILKDKDGRIELGLPVTATSAIRSSAMARSSGRPSARCSPRS